MRLSRFLAFGFAACIAIAGCSDVESNVTGKVSCEGKPVKGVAISDGEQIVFTDWRGRYKMNSSKPCGYVFMSIPSGYEAPVNGIIPQFFGYTTGAENLDVIDFKLNKVDNDSFTMFVTTDIHLTGDAVDDDIRQFNLWFKPDIIQAIQETEGPVYSVCLGDMSTDSKWHVNNFGLSEYLQAMEGYPGAIFHIPGNHDNERYELAAEDENQDDLSGEPYRRIIGPNYYSFNLGRYHFLMLDSITLKRSKNKVVNEYGLNPMQLEWARRDLETIDKDTPLIICTHLPPYLYGGIEDGKPVMNSKNPIITEQLMELAEGFTHVDIFAGHYHSTHNLQINEHVRQHEIVSASAVSWKLNGPESRLVAEDGTMGGYSIFKFDGEDMSWQYKANGFAIEDNQFRAYDLNCLPTDLGGEPGSNKLLVNVYNWDEQWTVEMFEGDKALDVKQVWRKDPLYIYVRRPELPHRPTAFLATDTLHMFEAEASSSDSDVLIKVTDRFGNVYTQTVVRPKTFSWEGN